MKFPPNHPQRIYVKKTPDATGLPQMTISWICQSPKSCTASSSAAAQNFQTVTTPPELPASSTAALLKMDSRPALRNDGGPFASMGRLLKLNTGRGTTSVKARLRSWSSTLQKIRHVKKTEIYLLWHLMQFHKL